MGRASIAFAILFGGCLAGCVEPSLVACDDQLCPGDTLCDTVHRGCISPEQAQVCVGGADHDSCRAGSVIGYCLDQVCIDPKCGNYVIDPGELCDDGNRDDGDGCSATCSSMQRCGDGALDSSLGSACDDGNLISHDGCDSQCRTETSLWTVDPLGPSHAAPTWTTYDAELGKVVVVADGNVWAWDGPHWLLAGTGGPRINGNYSIVFDTDRMRLLAIAQHPQNGDTIIPNPPLDQFYEWDGTAWTMSTLTNPPGVSSFVATYDESRHKVVAFGMTLIGAPVVAALDTTTLAWATLGAPNGFTGATGLTLAYDKTRGRDVAIANVGGVPVTADGSGVTWTTTSAAMASSGGWTAFYDPSISRVVVIGTSSATATTAAQSWSGTAWSLLAAVPLRRSQPSVAFDVTRNVRVVFGGVEAPITDDVVEGSGTTWTIAPRTTPPPGVDHVCAFDDGRRRLVCVGPGESNSDTWGWNGAWSRITNDPQDAPPSLAYDPVRAALVGLLTSQLVLLGDTSWQLGPSVGEAAAQAIVFDPTTAQLVANTTGMFSGESTTLFIDEQGQSRSISSPRLNSLAVDARNGAIVGTTDNGALQLGNDVWAPIVSPGAGFTALTNARRGTVEFVGAPHDVERIGASFIDLAPPPYKLAGSSAFDPATGELFTIGSDGMSRFMLRRSWQSETPFEDCSATADADGDGLAGCDDPDCWVTCHPTCPPLTTCP